MQIDMRDSYENRPITSCHSGVGRNLRHWRTAGGLDWKRTLDCRVKALHLYLHYKCKQDEPDNDNNGNIFSFFVVRLKPMDDCEKFFLKRKGRRSNLTLKNSSLNPEIATPR